MDIICMRLVSKMVWCGLFCGTAFTGVDDIHIWCILQWFCVSGMIVLTHAWLHEIFTNYGVFWFGESGD